MDLEILDRLYQAPTPQPSRYIQVRHEGLRSFYFALARLQRELRERDISDPYLIPLLRALGRFRFDASAVPLAFRDQPSRVAPLRLQEFCLRFEQHYPQLHDLASHVASLHSSLMGSDENPLLSGIWSALDREVASVGIVLAHARLKPRVEALLAHDYLLGGARVLSQDDLRSDGWFGQLVVVGAPRWFDRFVFEAPRAAEITCVYFGWTGRRVPREPLFACSTGTLVHAPIPESMPPGEPDEDEEALSIDDLVLDAVSTGALLADLQRKAGGESHGAGDRESVQARAFLLEGGRGVFLEADETASALVLDLEELGRKRVHRLPVSELRQGTIVVLRVSGGGDYVVPVADQLLAHRAAELRARQREWKVFLWAAIDLHGLPQVCADLQRLGGVLADEVNVRRWAGERSIRPRQRSDFHAIMVQIGRQNEEERFWRAMEQIDRAHLGAGQLIRRALLERVRAVDGEELARAGYMEFDLPRMDVARMVACRIVGVGGELTLVDASNIGRLFELEDD
jgi:hypothetical protein